MNSWWSDSQVRFFMPFSGLLLLFPPSIRRRRRRLEERCQILNLFLVLFITQRSQDSNTRTRPLAQYLPPPDTCRIRPNQINEALKG